MTTRTIIVGENPIVVIRAGGSTRVEGTDSEKSHCYY